MVFRILNNEINPHTINAVPAVSKMAWGIIIKCKSDEGRKFPTKQMPVNSSASIYK